MQGWLQRGQGHRHQLGNAIPIPGALQHGRAAWAAMERLAGHSKVCGGPGELQRALRWETSHERKGWKLLKWEAGMQLGSLSGHLGVSHARPVLSSRPLCPAAGCPHPLSLSLPRYLRLPWVLAVLLLLLLPTLACVPVCCERQHGCFPGLLISIASPAAPAPQRVLGTGTASFLPSAVLRAMASTAQPLQRAPGRVPAPRSP